MGLATIPSSTLISNNVSNSLPLSFAAKTPHIPCHKLKRNSKIFFRGRSFLLSGLIKENSFLRYEGASSATLGADNSGSGEEDKRALEAVLKLYDAIREGNTSDLSEVIGEECRCVSNFIPAFQPCHGKKQVLYFFTTLMKILGNTIQFEVQPTLHDGMNVGISWKLEWRKNGVPLGKGFSFYMCHVYRGKVMIRNVEMFMEPLFHFEPIILKMIWFVTNVMDKNAMDKNVMDKIGANTAHKTIMKRAIYLLLTLPLMITLFFFTKHFSY